MDKTRIEESSVVSIPWGFPKQRFYAVPRSIVDQLLRQPGRSHLVVTECGYFPEAHSHGITRRTGAAQTIVLVCVRGGGWAKIAGVHHEIGAGDVVVLPAHLPHAYGADAEQPWSLWWMHIMGTELPRFLSTVGLSAERPVRHVRDMFRIVALMEEIVNSIGHDTSDSSLLEATGAAWNVVSRLAAVRSGAASRDHVIDQAKEYFRQNLESQVSIGELASIAQLSRSHFASLFRHSVGMSPLQYQKQLRMARARELLNTTDMTIAEVAAHVGYPDPMYFSRQFTMNHGFSASHYRNLDKG